MNYILNLANPEKGEINYEPFKFPDGQQSIKINDDKIKGNDITIISRLNSFLDLEMIVCANQALKNLESGAIDLYIPYFLGGRSDRKFFEGGVNYLSQVISPLINSQGFNKVFTMDPHSDVLEACINNFRKIDNSSVVKFAIDSIGGDLDNIVLVSPDGGALKKIYDIAKKFGINKVINATKHRDIESGQILKTEIPDNPYKEGHTFLIVDDICDGGRTFTELAQVLRNDISNESPIYLVVSHGIFSKGFEELAKNIDGIFTSNSVDDIIMKDKLRGLYEYKNSKSESLVYKSDYVKQMNVLKSSSIYYTFKLEKEY
jgi:ribose-phosphate pyrophosphokinase